MKKQTLTAFINLTLSAFLACGTNYCFAQMAPAAEQPDYTGTTPNFANSPSPVPDPENPGQYLADPDVPGKLLNGIRKFVDSLPGLGSGQANNLGQYIPLAMAIANPSFPNDDYYEIGLFDYTQKMSSDLPPTKLRGYRDLNPEADGANHYLGPLIIANKISLSVLSSSTILLQEARATFSYLVDTSIMGAGMGRIM